jgi:hypothetical protein
MRHLLGEWWNEQLLPDDALEQPKRLLPGRCRQLLPQTT